MTHYPGIAAARERSDRVDALIARLARELPGDVAVVALGAYGRRELTPHADTEILVLHSQNLSTQTVTEKISYPLWEQAIRVEPLVRTPAESDSDARRSWSAATRFLDMRFIAGKQALFEELRRRTTPWRKDRERLRHRLRSDAQHRHTTHPSPACSTTPDILGGRGGLLDFHAVRWLHNSPESERTPQALDFLLTTLWKTEELVGHAPHRLSSRILERLDPDHSSAFLEQLHAHGRWIAFTLDSALAPVRDDRDLGPGLALRRGRLISDQPPALERAPSFGLRVANLVGLAPASAELLHWADCDGSPLPADEASQEQLWLFLRAADWRSWDFLDVTGLLTRYLPELKTIWRKPGSPRTGALAVDTHSFLALRCLHEWTESDDLLARRAWRGLRHRDWVYLAVLLHELAPDAAASAAQRIGLPEAAAETIKMAVASYQRVVDTATRRDLHDEDLLLELATHLGNRQHLSSVFLVAVAHEMACGAAAWSPWKADLMRQLFGQLEVAQRQPSEVGARRTRSVELHRDRVVRELHRRGLEPLVPLVGRLPRRYILTHTPAFVARHLALLARSELRDGEVRIQAHKRRQPVLWDVLLVARDRPGLRAMVAGVLSLRGASVLAADAATSADGLVLDVFTVRGADALQWSQVEADLGSALQGRIPLHDLLGSRPMEPEDAAAIHVAIDSVASQFFNLVEVRAPDQVGLLYRIASALHAEGLDIHHARIATHAEGALDVFYVRDLSGDKLSELDAERVSAALTARLRGER
jgi:[protein-PII] uridylyltransferase